MTTPHAKSHNAARLTTVSAATGALTLAFGLALPAVMGAPSTASAASGGVSCEIAVSPRSGGVALQGKVFADHAVSGSYELIVTQSGGGGGSDIQQAGDFSAAAGRSATLGTVVIGGDGGSFKARLKVKWDGSSAACRQSGSL